MSKRPTHHSPAADPLRKRRRRYRSGVRPLEDRLALSASPWSPADGDDSSAADSFVAIESSGEAVAAVTGVYAGGSSWNAAFADYLVGAGLSDVNGYIELSRGA